MNRSALACTAILAVSLLAHGILTAGPLDPPAGPVSPSYKTLNEVEPRIPIGPTTTPGDATSIYRIVAPGSYYLTGNLTGQSGKNGIVIAASNVTIDLRGYAVQGVSGSLDGIATGGASSTSSNAVLNGSISGWSGDGVDFETVASYGARIADLRIRSCGVYGINAGPGSEITHCVCTSNASNGIIASLANTVSECTAYSNTGAGIVLGGGSTISHCTAYDNNAAGISCTLSTISECTCVSNFTHGIQGGTGSTISHCSCRANTNDGINFSTACQIRDNTCTSNGVGSADGANIHATGADNRIEGNLCSSADRGIDVDIAGNFITRNTCSGNTTNWDVVAGNICLVVSAAAAPAILGSSGGTAPGSADPNANFTY